MKNTPAKDLDKFVLRLPNGLRERIKSAAEENNRSMNAEIVSTLEAAYPVPSIDLKVLTGFLNSLVGISAPDGDRDYLNYLNATLAKSEQPWSVSAGWDGHISFYPVAAPPEPSESDEGK